MVRPAVVASIALALAACSDKNGPAKPAPGTPAPAKPGSGSAAAPATAIADWLPADATGLGVFAGANSPLDMYIGNYLHARDAACFTELEKAARRSYMIEHLPAPGSVTVIEGDLPRAKVEACLPKIFADPVPVRLTSAADGDYLRVDVSGLGAPQSFYLAWVGGRIYTGSRAEVDWAAKPVAAARTDPRWVALLAQLGTEPTTIARQDVLFEKLIGLPTVGWTLGMNAETCPVKPCPVKFTGRVTVLFPDRATATDAARRWNAGALAIELPAKLAAARKAITATTDGPALLLPFDENVIADIDIADVQAWAAQLIAAAP